MKVFILYLHNLPIINLLDFNAILTLFNPKTFNFFQFSPQKSANYVKFTKEESTSWKILLKKLQVLDTFQLLSCVKNLGGNFFTYRGVEKKFVLAAEYLPMNDTI